MREIVAHTNPTRKPLVSIRFRQTDIIKLGIGFGLALDSGYSLFILLYPFVLFPVLNRFQAIGFRSSDYSLTSIFINSYKLVIHMADL